MSQRHRIQNNRMMFVTIATLNREPFFEHAPIAREAVETLYRVKALHPFLLHGFVVMPDHCHFLMTILPPEKISTIIGTFKSGLTFNTGIPQIWQPRSYIRIVRTTPENVLRYIHMNPVEASMVERSNAYPWSSASGKWDVDQITPRPRMYS